MQSYFGSSRLFGKYFISLASSVKHFSRTVPVWQKGDGSEPLTLTSQTNGIRTICLNNPKKRNALSLAMLKSLRDDILHDVDSQDLRVILITHQGPVFSSGHDLKELTSKAGREYHRQVFDECSNVMKLVQDVPVPVIARVNGLATAAGCQLVASCDIAVVSENSKFATPGVNIGLFCSTPGVALVRSVPRKVAMEMLFTGWPISAADALRHGLVSRVVPEDKLEDEAMMIAERICETSRSVVSLGKACFYEQASVDRNTAYSLAGQVMVSNLQLDDGKEGINAFLEKRKPGWTHNEKPAEE